MGVMADAPIVVIVGNPQSGSRTQHVAELVAGRLAALYAVPPAIETIDVAEHGAALLSWGDPTVASLKASVLGARALVVASPTYKAAYTGLLKLFLDQFGAGELAGVPTVAFMTGGSPAHSLAVDVHLSPVLVEIGASLPARGLYVCGPDIDEPTAVLDAWFAAADRPLRRALAT
jgi:FMN reductase